MHNPLVSVICLCYNHEHFVAEALQSVLNQTYQNIQIIIVDDASTDNSKTHIRKIVTDYPSVHFIALDVNLGICKAFNKAFALAIGNFIIDFATDDIMEPEKIQQQVIFFSQLDKSYGVVFTDAIYIDASGKFLRNHFDYLFKKKLLNHIPTGDVYCNVLSTYFIASPTMMVRREVFDALKGYDENLSYEDFDFWVRSARNFKYAFLNKKLMRIRRSAHSMSTRWYEPGDEQLHATYLICKKAQVMNETEEQKNALLKRVRYELRQSVFSHNHNEAKNFFELMRELQGIKLFDRFIYSLNKLPLPLAYIRKIYHNLVYETN